MQWLMLQQQHPQDYVIATGVQYSVRDFINAAAQALDMHITWSGTGVDETGSDATGRVIVRVDPRYFRPTEVETLLGDPSRARQELGWTPKISFVDMVAEMVREDLASAERDALVQRNGFRPLSFHE
jgi:GDPmannose 4,6-dehydratase